ncbi:hypothetical protein CVS40_5089 [Lucilia cuprina]|nr:hypothetical protein CVS40_9094 [Lucilia cuprina]KAI8124640.1 hypothetical protein CVS40_5089 [Lucilia cuprina]
MAPAAKCGVCSKNVTRSDSGVECESCKVWFHTICVNVSDELYALLGNNNNISFNCTHCIANPNASGDDSIMRKYIDELDKKIIANFSTFTAEMRNEQQCLKDLIESSIHDIRSDLSTSLNEFRTSLKQCNESIKNVEANTKERITVLEAENNKLQRRINRPDIIISGLPSGIDDLLVPVLAICKHYKVTADVKDINHCLYIQQGKSLLVKFNNVHLRDMIMKSYFKTPKLQLRDVIGTDIDARVYLNDNLTSASIRLQILCRSLRKEKKITWFRILNRDVPLAKIKFPDGTEKEMDFFTCSKL